MRKCLTPIGAIDENDLQFVRERYGEPRFGIPAPYTKNKDGSYKQINPHESRFIMPDGKFCSVFHIKPIYYATPQGTWRPLSEVASYFGNKRGMTLKEGWEQKMDMGYLVWYTKRLEVMKSQYGVAVSYPQTFAGIELTPVQIPLLLNASPLTAYPDPHNEVTTVDGYVAHYASGGAVWATIKAGAGTEADDDAGISQVSLNANVANADKWEYIYRGIFLFNTSSIPADNVISSATMSLKGTSKTDNGTAVAPTLNIYASAPASNVALVAGDFDSLGTIDFSTDIAYADFSITGYNDFALNGADGDGVGVSGIGSIVKGVGGISKFGYRESTYDAGTSTPTWSSGSIHQMRTTDADVADTTSDPKLVVNYGEAASGPANLKSLNTNAKSNIKSVSGNLIANCKSYNTNI